MNNDFPPPCIQGTENNISTNHGNHYYKHHHYGYVNSNNKHDENDKNYDNQY